MPVGPADHTIRNAVSDILSNFLSEYEWEDGPLASLRDKVYRVYSPQHVGAYMLQGLTRGNSELGLRDQHRFLYLEPVDVNILPLLTLETSDQWVHFRVYVLLTMLDQCSKLKCLAIRFETDEGGLESDHGSHDFCHAQFCRRINDTPLPKVPNWIPDSQPSFPLDAENQVGLVLCMLTSLYGRRRVFDKLNTTGDPVIREHMKNNRALANRRAV